MPDSSRVAATVRVSRDQVRRLMVIRGTGPVSNCEAPAIRGSPSPTFSPAYRREGVIPPRMTPCSRPGHGPSASITRITQHRDRHRARERAPASPTSLHRDPFDFPRPPRIRAARARGALASRAAAAGAGAFQTVRRHHPCHRHSNADRVTARDLMCDCDPTSHPYPTNSNTHCHCTSAGGMADDYCRIPPTSRSLIPDEAQVPAFGTVQFAPLAGLNRREAESRRRRPRRGN
jgi:hypothetical protein